MDKITFDNPTDLCKWLLNNPEKILFDNCGRVWRTSNNIIYFKEPKESRYIPTKNPYFVKTELTFK
mgnify:CR=1 FL=1